MRSELWDVIFFCYNSNNTIIRIIARDPLRLTAEPRHTPASRARTKRGAFGNLVPDSGSLTQWEFSCWSFWCAVSLGPIFWRRNVMAEISDPDSTAPENWSPLYYYRYFSVHEHALPLESKSQFGADFEKNTDSVEPRSRRIFLYGSI